MSNETAALDYAAHGLEILPAKETDKTPYTAHGMLDASADVATITGWWRRHPSALVACRIPEGVVVLDIDPGRGGHNTWAALEAECGAIVAGRIHASGGHPDGRHIWFERPPGKLSAKGLNAWAKDHGTGTEVINPDTGTRTWVAGIDILHHGHRYSILPPSVHPKTEMPYRWLKEGQPGPLPDWLTNLLVTPPAPPTPPPEPYDGDSIADWYSTTARWADILAGWTLVGGDGEQDGSKWRHPTATGNHSATIRHACLFNYSPNTGLEETEADDPHGYTKFRAFTEFAHDGDGKAAAAAAFEMRDGATSLPPNVTYVSSFDEDDGDDSAVWPEPVPLSTQTAGPPFPVGELPQWMQAHVLSVATEQQVAADLPAMLGLAALALINTKRYRLRVQASWWEPMNLYLVVALAPSAGKSPVFKRMFGPIAAFEEEQACWAEVEAEKVAQDRRMIEKAMKAAEEKGHKDDAREALRELRETPEVVAPRLTVDDITVEALVDVLGQQGGRLGVLSPEGGLFDAMAGRYSDHSNLDPYLMAWSGDTIKVDRIGRGSTVVRDPLLTIGLTVQPAVIEALGARIEMVGRGLAARFLYSMPEDTVGHRDFTTRRGGDQGAAEVYSGRLDWMLRQPVYDEPVPLVLHEKAWQRFAQWRQSLEDRRTPDGDLRPMASWTSKLESSVARLAGLLHIADQDQDHDNASEVADDTMRRAITIGEYWLAHGRIVHDMWGSDPVMNRAKTILAWARDTNRREFTMRDAFTHRRASLAGVEDVIEPLKLLLDLGWIRQTNDSPLVAGRRGKASPAFQAHPNLWITTSHATHATHAPRDTKNSLSIYLKGDMGKGALSHESHESHEPRTAHSPDRRVNTTEVGL